MFWPLELFSGTLFLPTSDLDASSVFWSSSVKVLGLTLRSLCREKERGREGERSGWERESHVVSFLGTLFYSNGLWAYVVVWKNMARKRSGTLRRCGLVWVGVVLLKEVCHCTVEVGFVVWNMLKIPHSVSDHFLLLVHQGVGFTTFSPAPCLPSRHHVSHHDNGLNLWTTRGPPHGHCVSSQ